MIHHGPKSSLGASITVNLSKTELQVKAVADASAKGTAGNAIGKGISNFGVSCSPSRPRDELGHAALTYLGWWFRCSLSAASPSLSPLSFSTDSYVDSALFLNRCRL